MPENPFRPELSRLTIGGREVGTVSGISFEVKGEPIGVRPEVVPSRSFTLSGPVRVVYEDRGELRRLFRPTPEEAAAMRARMATAFDRAASALLLFGNRVAEALAPLAALLPPEPPARPSRGWRRHERRRKAMARR
jgi:hypothetical protein